MYLCLFFQIPTTPECRPQPSSGGGRHRHSDLLQEQRLRGVDTGRWHRHPALWVRRSSALMWWMLRLQENWWLRMFLMKNEGVRKRAVMLTVCAGSLLRSHHNSLWWPHCLLQGALLLTFTICPNFMFSLGYFINWHFVRLTMTDSYLCSFSEQLCRQWSGIILCQVCTYLNHSCS